MSMTINTKAIPELSVGFSRGRDMLGGLISLCRGGPGAIFNNNFPTHAFMFTCYQGQLFATEEGPSGLVEDSISQYCQSNDQIVKIMYWSGWDDHIKKGGALAHLAEIRAAGGPRAAYGYSILPYFLPLIGGWFKPKPQTLIDGSEICSEDVAGIHICDGGAKWLSTKLLAPDELLDAMVKSGECREITPVYI